MSARVRLLLVRFSWLLCPYAREQYDDHHEVNGPDENLVTVSELHCEIERYGERGDQEDRQRDYVSHS